MSDLKLSVIVDYAHEPESIKQVLKTALEWKKRGFYDKIIHVVSCCGAGRDDWKKPIIGTQSYLDSDFSVVTTEDYDSSDDPNEILKLLTAEYPKETEIDSTDNYNQNSKYIKEINRKKALRIANKIANKMAQLESTEQALKVLVLSTSIGSQQTMTQPEGEIKYDEREEWRVIAGEMI
jgi:UDP-N-acetylmuramoyl-L-alanyl-D-glutamate--2,6-diaminopimelate ligase